MNGEPVSHGGRSAAFMPLHDWTHSESDEFQEQQTTMELEAA
jgi:hypothetical protein